MASQKCVCLSAVDHDTDITNGIDGFTLGTLITTSEGKRKVEDLRQDDLILTRDHGFQPLLWHCTCMRVLGQSKKTKTARYKISLHDAPVSINASALGPGQPARDMIVSPRHRFLVHKPKFAKTVREPEVLVEARWLTCWPGIKHVNMTNVRYVHLLFERHEIIVAENSWVESLQISKLIARRLAKSECFEFKSTFPSIRSNFQEIVQSPARRCLGPKHLT